MKKGRRRKKMCCFKPVICEDHPRRRSSLLVVVESLSQLYISGLMKIGREVSKLSPTSFIELTYGLYSSVYC